MKMSMLRNVNAVWFVGPPDFFKLSLSFTSGFTLSVKDDIRIK